MLTQEIAQLELALEEFEAEAATADQRKVSPAKLERPSPVRSLPAHLPRERASTSPHRVSSTAFCPALWAMLMPRN